MTASPTRPLRALDRLGLLPPAAPQTAGRRLLIGAVCGLLSVATRLPFEPVLAGSLPFVFFLPAITVAAVRGGRLAAAAAVGLDIVYLLGASPYLKLFNLAWGLPFALFLLASGLTTLVAEELRRTLAGLRAREEELRTAYERVSHSETLQGAILASSTDYAIITLDPRGRVTSWNEGAEQIMGWTEAEMLGQPAHIFFTAEEIAGGVPEAEMRMARERGRGEDERFHLRKGGERFWANGLMMPLRTDEGADLGFLKILRDRTLQHQTEQALRASEARLRLERSTLEAIFQAAPVGLSLTEAPSGRSILVNDEVRRLTGRELGGGGTERYQRAGARHPDGRPFAPEDYPTMRALRTGETIKAEPTLFERPDGTTVRTELSSTPLRDSSGAVAAAVTVVVDVEAREQAAERQRLLLDELAHRMKNTLTIVQAIVSQTLRSAADMDAARGEIMQRLGVLSRAQDVLTRTSWAGASLHDVVDAAMAPHALGPERLEVDGPEVQIGSRAALSFTLALHELATNALKYGALSTPEGRLRIGWTCVPGPADAPCGRLRFAWSEAGGPPVRPPASRGFGSRLIDSLGRTFAGESELSYDPAGVRWRVEAEMEALQAF